MVLRGFRGYLGVVSRLKSNKNQCKTELREVNECIGCNKKLEVRRDICFGMYSFSRNMHWIPL